MEKAFFEREINDKRIKRATQNNTFALLLFLCRRYRLCVIASRSSFFIMLSK